MSGSIPTAEESETLAQMIRDAKRYGPADFEAEHGETFEAFMKRKQEENDAQVQDHSIRAAR